MYGSFRQLNLRRGTTDFVDFRHVPAALEALLALARRAAHADAEAALWFATRWFADFLSIHPFLNGNRRMALLLVRHQLAPWGVRLDWAAVGPAEHTYWMRCAQRGRIGVLYAGLRRHVQWRAAVHCPSTPDLQGELA